MIIKLQMVYKPNRAIQFRAHQLTSLLLKGNIKATNPKNTVKINYTNYPLVGAVHSKT